MEEGSIRICMLEKGKFSTLRSPANGGGTILEKGKVRQLEENTMHKLVGGGKIKDPEGGGNIDLGGSQTDFDKCVDTLVNHEVQELKHHRSIKEEAEETRNETQMNKGYRKMSKEEIQMEMDLRGLDGTGPKGDPGGTGFNEKENRKEEPRNFLRKRLKMRRSTR